MSNNFTIPVLNFTYNVNINNTVGSAIVVMVLAGVSLHI